MWLRHNKTPGWFKKRPRGEQIFLLAADMWQLEQESKPRSFSGLQQQAPPERRTISTISIQDFARLK